MDKKHWYRGNPIVTAVRALFRTVPPNSNRRNLWSQSQKQFASAWRTRLRCAVTVPRRGTNQTQNHAVGMVFLSSTPGRISWLFLTLSILIFWSNEGFAQSDSGGGEIAVPEVVVEEKVMASAQKAILDKRQAPNAMTVIEFDQLNQFGDQPLGDAMRRLPGITFPGGNRARDIQLRGIGVQYTQVLVNGRPLMDGNSSRSVQVDRIPSSLVERIEIIRSPLANQDGQGTAGTVNIILKNQRFDSTRQLGLGGGYLDKNDGVGDSTVVYAGQEGPFRFSLTGGIQRQRRNESKSTYTFTGSGAPNAGVLEGNERRFDQINLVPAFELDAGAYDTFRIEPSYLRTEEFRDDVQRDLATNQSSVQRTEFENRDRVRENYGLFGSWTHRLSETTKWTASVDFQQAREDTLRDATRFTAGGSVDRTRQRTEDIDLRWIRPNVAFHHRIGIHAMELGGNYSRAARDEGNSDRQNGAALPPNAARLYSVRETRWNGYLLDTMQFQAGDRLSIGIRLEDSTTETTDFFGRSNSVSKLIPLPSISYVYPLTPTTDLRAGGARTLRRPDLRELSPAVQVAAGTQANPDLGGNPNLTPEAVWGVDIGVDHYLLDNTGVLSINAFSRWFNDKIETVADQDNSRFVSRPLNIGSGQMQGVEIEGRVPLTHLGLANVALWGNGAAMRTRLDDPATGQTRRFLNQPDYVANAGLDYVVPPIGATFGINANWVSGYNQTFRLADGRTQNNDVKDALRVDLSARFQLSKWALLNFSFLNIFAEAEKRRDQFSNAAGALTSSAFTSEPTYRMFYVRLRIDW